MAPGKSGNVTMNLADNASTIAQKLVTVPALNTVLLEADSLAGLTAGTNNAFNSHSRLHVILNKSGPNVETKIRLVEGLF